MTTATTVDSKAKANGSKALVQVKGKAKKGKAAAPERVAGVLMDLVKPALVTSHLEKLKLDLSGTVPEKVERLAKHFEENPGDVADCQDCGGLSDAETTDVCPYCGSGDDEQSGGESALVRKAADTLLRGDDEESDDVPDTRFSVADLDDALVKVELAKQAEVGSFWDLGKAIHDIFSNKLYLQRRGDGGKPLYRSWSQFCSAELSMTSQHAYRVMDVAANFDRPTAVRFGVAKLNTLLRIENPEQRAKLLPAAEKLSRDELTEKVREVVAASGGGAGRGRLTPAQAERNKKAQKESADKRAEVPAAQRKGAETVTCAVALGRTTVKLYFKGSRPQDEDPKRAKRLGDGPVGWEESVNGVRTLYSVATDAKGFLVLSVARSRV